MTIKVWQTLSPYAIFGSSPPLTLPPPPRISHTKTPTIPDPLLPRPPDPITSGTPGMVLSTGLIRNTQCYKVDQPLLFLQFVCYVYHTIHTFCKKMPCNQLITVHNEVAKVTFLHLSVCPQGGGLPQWMLGYHLPQSRHPPVADTPSGAGTPHSRHPPSSRPPSRWLLLRTLCLLLECILVNDYVLK